MTESVVLQAIEAKGIEKGREEGRVKGRVEGMEEGLKEGRVTEARSFLLKLGERRLGTPDVQVVSRLNDIQSLERLEFLGTRLFEVESWSEILGGI